MTTTSTACSTPRSLAFPPALRPGDTVAVVAPSGPFEHAPAWRALGWLSERYRVRFSRGLFASDGYLAGPDPRRRDELAAALIDPEVRAVIAARGGYGASRVAHGLDWSAFANSPRWILGFSDITVLHAEATRVGVASIHGPNLTTYGRSDAKSRAAILHALEHPADARTFRGLSVVHKGAATGPLVGGNLTLLHACAAAGRLAIPEGAVLLLEDVSERPYRIDRMLASLSAGGYLARVSAVVLGDFTQCEPGPEGTTFESVLRFHLGALGIPVVAGVPVGHGPLNEPVVLGAEARVVAQGTEGELHLAG